MSENNSLNSEITAVQLTPYNAIIKGELGVSSFIVNDYVINVIDNTGSYTVEITKGSQTQNFTLSDPVSIDSVFQVASSQGSGGLNTFRILLTDGTFTDFDFYNGGQGEKGDPGLTPAEKKEIEDAEYERVQAENARVSAESRRASNESDRVFTEDDRVAKESVRVSHEDARVVSENERMSAEGERASAENTRVENERGRVAAESARSSKWTELKGDVENAIFQISGLEDEVETLADKVDGAASDVLEAYINVNNHITQSQELLEQVDEASSDIINLSVQSTTLQPGSNASVTYSDGVMIFGIPKGLKGDTGDSFKIVKTYSSIAAMNEDYQDTDVKVGEFVMIVSTVEDPDNAKIYVKGDSAYVFIADMSGATGIQGPPGTDGMSPEIVTSVISHGHTVTIFDSTGTKQFNVYDGDSVTGVDFQIDNDGNLQYKVSIN